MPRLQNCNAYASRRLALAWLLLTLLVLHACARPQHLAWRLRENPSEDTSAQGPNDGPVSWELKTLASLDDGAVSMGWTLVYWIWFTKMVEENDYLNEDNVFKKRLHSDEQVWTYELPDSTHRVVEVGVMVIEATPFYAVKQSFLEWVVGLHQVNSTPQSIFFNPRQETMMVGAQYEGQSHYELLGIRKGDANNELAFGFVVTVRNPNQ